MKIAFAALLTAAGLMVAGAAPASAESSYWDKRYQNGDVPEAGRTRLERPRFATRSRGERRRVVERRVRADRYRNCDCGPRDRYAAVPNPFRVEEPDGRAHPTMNNNYWIQRSIYDFQDGKAADIKQYRD